MKPYPDFTKHVLTYGETCGYACEITDPTEAARFINDLCLWHIREGHHASLEAAYKTEMVNIGYCAGYYNEETQQRVYRLFGAVHPIFGTAQPTAEEAIEADKKLAGGK